MHALTRPYVGYGLHRLYVLDVIDELVVQSQPAMPRLRKARQALVTPGGPPHDGGATVGNTNSPGPQDVPEGWHVWQTDSGHWWATRRKAYDPREEAAGAWRTVEAPTEEQLRAAIDAQEAIVARAWGRAR